MINLPTDLLRTFLEVVETGSMLRASEQVFVTPSAISLQVKRLEGLCQSPLFFRDGRKLTLTPGGHLLLDYARAMLKANDEAVDALRGERAVGVVRIGMVEDFARTLLVGTLRRFTELNPEAQVHLRVCGSQELRELIAANRMDIAIYMSPTDAPGVIVRRKTCWFGKAELTERSALPLAVLEKPCLFREHALAALEAADIPFEIVVETGSVSALQAAVDAGLGITPRVATALRVENTVEGLPVLPDVGFSIVTSFAPTRTTTSLQRILATSLGDI